jgi:hypothetical protein
LKLALFKGPSRVDVSLPSLEDGNRSRILTVVFSCYLESLAMSRVLKPSDSDSLRGIKSTLMYEVLDGQKKTT